MGPSIRTVIIAPFRQMVGSSVLMGNATLVRVRMQRAGMRVRWWAAKGPTARGWGYFNSSARSYELDSYSLEIIKCPS